MVGPFSSVFVLLAGNDVISSAVKQAAFMSCRLTKETYHGRTLTMKVAMMENTASLKP